MRRILQESDITTFIPDPATVKSDRKLKIFLQEMDLLYMRNCSKLNKSLTTEENSQVIGSNIILLKEPKND